jgi:hypothetical protein
LLKMDVAGLLVDNHTIKASLGGGIVRIDNEAFHSAEEVKRWIVDRIGSSPGAYEFFFDVMSISKMREGPQMKHWILKPFPARQIIGL